MTAEKTSRRPLWTAERSELVESLSDLQSRNQTPSIAKKLKSLAKRIRAFNEKPGVKQIKLEG